MAALTFKRLIFSVISRRSSSASSSSSSRPWLSDKGNPILNWDLPRDPTPIPNSILPAEEKVEEVEEIIDTKSVSFQEDEEEKSLAKISRIVRKNGDEMESELQSSGLQVSPQLMEKLLESSEYSWKPVFRCFSWASLQPGFTHTSRACNMMINIMTKMREFDSAWGLVSQMKEKSQITAETFAILMRRYARAGNSKEALRTFDSIEKFGLKSDSEAFNVLLDALCKEGRVEAAEAYFMKRKPQIECGRVTYNILIHGWTRVGRLENAKKLFDEMVSHGIPPCVVTYTTLIDGYCRVGKLDDALELMHTMKDKGCNPNVITCNTIVDALAEAGKSEHVLTMINEMDANNCKPNISTYNSAVKGLCKREDLSGASRVLQLMMERGCLPTSKTYSYFFWVFSKNGRVNEGMNLYLKMLDSGYALDRLSYQLLVKMLCEKGRVELAIQVMKDMESQGCDPDLATCTMVVHRLCRLNKLDEAYEHFGKMIQKGISPQYVTYVMMCEKLRKSDWPDRCRLLSEMMAGIRHSKRLPNTYRSGPLQGRRTKTMVSEDRETTRRLKTRRYYKQPPTVIS